MYSGYGYGARDPYASAAARELNRAARTERTIERAAYDRAVRTERAVERAAYGVRPMDPYAVGVAPVGTVGMDCRGAAFHGRMVKIIALPYGRALTSIDEPGAMGKRGRIIPREYVGGPHQHWRIEPAAAFPGAIKIVSASNPNHVLRHTPMQPMEKVALWINEPGSPNQCWRKHGEHIHPEGHPNLHLHYDQLTGGFGVKMEPQRFLFEMVGGAGMGMGMM